MLTMLNRMCWNFRGWRFPTNTPGDGGYPSKVGFGHEEWNFQIEDAVDGFVYGYLYYWPAQRKIREAGGHFRIGFWGIHPETREKLLVGIYNDATLPTEEDYVNVDRAFTSRGIYKRRAQELCTVVSSISFDEAYREVTDSVRKHWLSFKCPVEDVHHLAEYVPVYEIVKSRTLGQYFARPTFIPSSELPSVPRRADPISKDKARPPRSAALAEDAYYRESPQHLRFIVRRHNKLSNRFAVWLKKSGFSNVVHPLSLGCQVANGQPGDLGWTGILEIESFIWRWHRYGSSLADVFHSRVVTGLLFIRTFVLMAIIHQFRQILQIGGVAQKQLCILAGYPIATADD